MVVVVEVVVVINSRSHISCSLLSHNESESLFFFTSFLRDIDRNLVA